MERNVPEEGFPDGEGPAGSAGPGSAMPGADGDAGTGVSDGEPAGASDDDGGPRGSVPDAVAAAGAGAPCESVAAVTVGRHARATTADDASDGGSAVPSYMGRHLTGGIPAIADGADGRGSGPDGRAGFLDDGEAAGGDRGAAAARSAAEIAAIAAIPRVEDLADAGVPPAGAAAEPGQGCDSGDPSVPADSPAEVGLGEGAAAEPEAKIAHGAAGAICAACAVVFFVLDRITKNWAIANVGGGTMEFIPGFMSFVLVFNEGASFGSMQGATALLLAISTVLCVLMIVYMVRWKRHTVYESAAIGAVLAGAIGNAFDRALYGEVTDFMNFEFIEFPVFNVADCCITIGIVVMLVFLFFDGSSPFVEAETEAERAGRRPDADAFPGQFPEGAQGPASSLAATLPEIGDGLEGAPADATVPLDPEAIEAACAADAADMAEAGTETGTEGRLGGGSDAGEA